MIRAASDISDAYDAGRHHIQPFYKVWPSTFNTAGAWYDATFAGSLPRASYYAGDDLKFTVYPSSNHLRHYAGSDVSPYQKIVKSIIIRGSGTAVAPSFYILCDFLGFYSGVSLEITDEQTMNNVTTLPRYTTGAGVMACLVQLFGSNTGSIGTMNYINQSGVAATSQTIRGNTLGTGSIQNASTANTYLPFINLAAGSTGVRSVTSITFSTTGTGVAVLVLLRPLCFIPIRDANLIAPYEREFASDMSQLPVVQDGACLNFLMSPSASPATVITMGSIEYIWG